MKRLYPLLFIINLCCTLHANAQPAWSRGIQNLAISVDECKLRAEKALQKQGYNIVNRGGDFFGAFKGKNTAIIACSAAPDGKTWANIFVASETNESNIPGAERVLLQQGMDIPSTAVAANPPVSTAPGVQATWGTQADNLRGKNGQRFTFYIPPGGTVSSRLWGTDIYTDDSPIANAAVHAGLITPQNGGTVTIEIREGQPSYKGSVRNGVTSMDYGGYAGSYILIGATPNTAQQPGIIRGTWASQANELNGKVGQQFTFQFPPGEISNRLWGTDIYTDDCSIATAAVHAGLISAQSGGTVTIELRGPQSSFKGTPRNGVTSRDWGAFPGSFVFVRR